MLLMGYRLTNEATGEVLKLGSREWEMLLKLAAIEAGPWEPQEGRDYTRGSIASEEASRMARSVGELLRHLSRGHAGEQPEETQRRPTGDFEPWTRQEMLNHLGYTEEDPLAFFSASRRRHMGERFIRLASKGAFEVIPEAELEPGG